MTEKKETIIEKEKDKLKIALIFFPKYLSRIIINEITVK